MADSPRSPSSLALDALLDEGGDAADAVREKINNRTTLWRYRTGRTVPPADVASEIEVLSAGRVPANGWASETAEVA